MRFAPAFPALTAMLLGLTLAASSARADDNDLVLSRLTVSTGASGFVPDNLQFRSLVSQLGVALAPRFLTPADTLGYSGFQFSTELSYTTIDHKAAYWCATEETATCEPGAKSTRALQTVGIFARKGIWLPLPSFEVGGGALHLLSSQMWAAQAYAKFAVHEGFHDWPIPSLAVRGAVSRLMGSEQLDLTIPSLDVTVSKSLGLAGTVNVTPYAGWNVLWMIVRSEVIDKTPNVDGGDPMNANDVTNNFVFPDQDNILRQRFFAGLKIKYYVFAFTAEAVFALSGKSVDDRSGVDTDCATAPAAEKANCDATDASKGQQTYTVSASMDF